MRCVAALGLLASLAFTGTARAQYVALGDSFTSGEGSGSYLAGSDVSGNHCHRSSFAYPNAVAAQLGLALSFHACSGSITPDFTHPNQDYRGEPAPQQNWIVPGTQLITLSDGGNDVGFAKVVETCILRATLKITASCTHRIDVARSAVAGERAELIKLYARLRGLVPAARILVLGYPRMFPADPPGHCGHGFLVSGFSRIQMQKANQLVDELDAAVAGAVAAVPGVQYVDVRRAFAGHTLCTPDAWVNAFRLSSVQETAHPKKPGQAAFATAVLACFRDAAKCGPRP